MYVYMYICSRNYCTDCVKVKESTRFCIIKDYRQIMKKKYQLQFIEEKMKTLPLDYYEQK